MAVGTWTRLRLLHSGHAADQPSKRREYLHTHTGMLANVCLRLSLHYQDSNPNFQAPKACVLPLHYSAPITLG